MFPSLSSSAAAPVCLQLLDRRAGREHVHGHIAAAAERRLEFLHHQEHLPIVGAGVVLRLDVDGPRLAGIGAAIEVGTRRNMGVIEAETCRLRQEGDPPHASCRHEGRAFLGRTVDVAWNHLPVPMHKLRHVSVIVDVDHCLLPFLEADERSGELAVIERGRHNMVRRELH